MKVSDYIVEFLIEKKITDVFGYPGGSVTNLIDSLYKKRDSIHAHVTYHEQAAAFAACGYSQIRGVPGVAYSTGGPGATNMITAIGHAYYDSIPVIFLTGNVNTYEAKMNLKVRQRGFQESDIISVVKPLTKYCEYVSKPEQIRYCLEKAYYFATNGRKGPVLLDLPMDVLRAQVNQETIDGFEEKATETIGEVKNDFMISVKDALERAKSPCLVLGNAIKTNNLQDLAQRTIDHLKIPYVSSMISFDVVGNNRFGVGFIGAYGIRAANFVVAKSDLVISIGSRLDVRQVGAVRCNFAPQAKLIRVDSDAGELMYSVHDNEEVFCMDVHDALEELDSINVKKSYSHWNSICDEIKKKLSGYDDRLPNKYISELSKYVPENASISTDVGQNQVWVAQSFLIKRGQKVLFSGGMGAMGHALPSAIGAYYGNGMPSICICGDGGLQMNIQELQFLAREQIPVKIIVINNYALGMIRHFQEMYFDGIYYQTTYNGGYSTPDFAKIAAAYGIENIVVDRLEDMDKICDFMKDSSPALIEIRIPENTYVFPKLEYGKPNQDQQPLLDRKLFNELMGMK